jgi:hypothetical protein
VHDLVQIGPANLAVVSDEAEASLNKKLTLIMRYLWVWRLSENDGLYSNDVRRMTRINDMPGENHGKLITGSITADLLYTPNKHFSMLVFGGIFKPGDYARNTGEGKNIEAFSVKATYRF